MHLSGARRWRPLRQCWRAQLRAVCAARCPKCWRGQASRANRCSRRIAANSCRRRGKRTFARWVGRDRSPKGYRCGAVRGVERRAQAPLARERPQRCSRYREEAGMGVPIGGTYRRHLLAAQRARNFQTADRATCDSAARRSGSSQRFKPEEARETRRVKRNPIAMGHAMTVPHGQRAVGVSADGTANWCGQHRHRWRARLYDGN